MYLVVSLVRKVVKMYFSDNYIMHLEWCLLWMHFNGIRKLVKTHFFSHITHSKKIKRCAACKWKYFYFQFLNNWFDLRMINEWQVPERYEGIRKEKFIKLLIITHCIIIIWNKIFMWRLQHYPLPYEDMCQNENNLKR